MIDEYATLRTAFNAGARIQAWTMKRPLLANPSTADGYWRDLPRPDEPKFTCPAHLYRVHPDYIALLPFDSDLVRDAGMRNWVRDAVDLLNAVTVGDFGGPRLRDVAGRNWFDVQDELLQAVPSAAIHAQTGGSES